MFYDENLFNILDTLHKNYEKLNETVNNLTNQQEIIALNKEIAKNKEFLNLAIEEESEFKNKIIELEIKLQKLLLPKDENDSKNVLVEMHSAAGGNESSIFVSNLFDAYKRYASTNNWKLTIIDLQENNYGISSLTFSLSGKNVYSKMKFESGVHRVQRVPVTESQGRVHTSTITVSIMPEQDDIEINIEPKDLRIDVYRASGAGGQHVNKTESAVRITHLPTNIIVTCQQERSQISNREQAMKILRSKLWKLKSEQQTKEITDMIREQVGRGMRSEKIRTYNYPQNRITDHRILLTINNLEEIMMDGNFQKIHESLINHEANENLKKLVS